MCNQLSVFWNPYKFQPSILVWHVNSPCRSLLCIIMWIFLLCHCKLGSIGCLSSHLTHGFKSYKVKTRQHLKRRWQHSAEMSPQHLHFHIFVSTNTILYLGLCNGKLYKELTVLYFKMWWMSKANTQMKGGCRSRIELFLCSEHHLLNYKGTAAARRMPESLIQSSAGWDKTSHV